ncbi:MAG: hypothetical protein V3R94_01460 [Acidobacteriota bacterium]
MSKKLMVFSRTILPTYLIITLCLMGNAPAQDKDQMKQLAVTTQGSTGLFNLFLARTLRRGEISIGLNYSHYHREPGDLDFTLFPVSLTVGVHDRAELFMSWEAQRRVHASAIEVHRSLAGSPVTPAQLKNGTTAFFNDAPFLDVGFGSGPGELRTGVKLNLFSEGRKYRFSMAIQPMVKFSLSESRSRLVRGLTNGSIEMGYDMILSKNLPRGGIFTFQNGFLFASDSQTIEHRFNYGLGYQLPVVTKKLQNIGELTGTVFMGKETPGANPKSPLDLYLGFRIWPSRHLSLSAAYNATLRRISPNSSPFDVQSTGRSGWLFQLSYHRKINKTPSLQCLPQEVVLTEGEQTTIRATIEDLDDSKLSLTWTANGGSISQRGILVIFDSTGLEANQYRVTAEVADANSVASCSTKIMVLSR